MSKQRWSALLCMTPPAAAHGARADSVPQPGVHQVPVLRGLHSSLVRLNVSAFYGIGIAFVGCLGVVEGVLGAIRK